MPIRPRAPLPDPARRIRAIFGEPAVTGWVPAPPAPPAQRAGPAAPGRSPVAAPPSAEVPEDLAPVAPVAAVGATVEPDPGRVRTSVVALLRVGRLDPGRRGAVALALVGLVAAVVAAVVLLRSRPSEQPLAVPGRVRTAAAVPSDHGGDVVVAVAGKIRHPGLVRLPAGSRVDDAVRAAGGVAPGASVGLVNLARKLIDGEQVLIGVEAPRAPLPGPGRVRPPGRAELRRSTSTRRQPPTSIVFPASVRCSPSGS